MKLVRDKIPDIIKENGAENDWEVTKCTLQKEKLNYLLAKLKEETKELLKEPCIEEIIDVLEVAYTIGNELGYTDNVLNMCRETKKAYRGGFTEGFLLKKTRE